MAPLRSPLPDPARRAAGALRDRGARRRHGRGVGAFGMDFGTRGLHPRRRGDRYDHGGQRVPRDHPRAPEARRRHRGGRGARRVARSCGRAALAPQQLPHAARRLRHDLEPLSDDVRASAGLADPGRAGAHRRLGQALLQPAARRAESPVDAGGRRRGTGARSRSSPRPGRRSRRRPGPRASPSTSARCAT